MPPAPAEAQWRGQARNCEMGALVAGKVSHEPGVERGHVRGAGPGSFRGAVMSGSIMLEEAIASGGAGSDASPRLRLRVTSQAEAALRGGHPWLFSGSIREQNRPGQP